jgi:hypothetical protein
MTAELPKFYMIFVLLKVSWHLNTGQILCEQQRELRLKCSEIEKGGGKKSE